MKILTLLATCLVSVLSGCNPSTNVLNRVNKKEAVIHSNNVYSYQYNTADMGLSYFSASYDNAYQYTLIGENYFYQSPFYDDTTDDVHYVFKQSQFNANNWQFGFYDYYRSYVVSGSGYSSVFIRVYFCRKDTNVRYYVVDSLFRYFYDNNVWNDYGLYLPEYLSLFDLTNIGDSVFIATGNSSGYSLFFGNNGDESEEYLPCNNVNTIHDIDDDYYPYYSSGFNYYDDTNVSVMNNCFSFFISGDNILDVFDSTQQEVYFKYDDIDYFANADYQNGYRDGYNVGSDEGYSEGRYDGYNDGYGDGYTDGNTDGYNDGYQEGEATGIQEGYSEGYSDGNSNGYVNGFNAGSESANTYTFPVLFGAIADTPVLIFRQLFNFDLFGTPALVIVMSLLTAIALIYVFKRMFK